jgi:hypothetical protein
VSNVKRRTLVLTVIAGLLVFIGVLAFYLPASWVAGALPPQVTCTELGGSVWSGECLGLKFKGAELGDASWNLAPLSALGGRLTGDAEVHGGDLNVRSRLDLSFNGSGELQDLVAQIPLSPQVIADFPANQRGRVVTNLKRVVLNRGASLGSLEGTVELHDFRQVGANPLLLGSYRVTFAATAEPSGANVGQLHDMGGPFAVEGTVSLTPPNAYVVQGFITGRTAEAEGLVREITLGARPDVSGRSLFSFEGTY